METGSLQQSENGKNYKSYTNYKSVRPLNTTIDDDHKEDDTISVHLTERSEDIKTYTNDLCKTIQDLSSSFDEQQKRFEDTPVHTFESITSELYHLVNQYTLFFKDMCRFRTLFSSFCFVIDPNNAHLLDPFNKVMEQISSTSEKFHCVHHILKKFFEDIRDLDQSFLCNTDCVPIPSENKIVIKGVEEFSHADFMPKDHVITKTKPVSYFPHKYHLDNLTCVLFQCAHMISMFYSDLSEVFTMMINRLHILKVLMIASHRHLYPIFRSIADHNSRPLKNPTHGMFH